MEEVVAVVAREKRHRASRLRFEGEARLVRAVAVDGAEDAVVGDAGGVAEGEDPRQRAA